MNQDRATRDFENDEITIDLTELFSVLLGKIHIIDQYVCLEQVRRNCRRDVKRSADRNSADTGLHGAHQEPYCA